VSNWVGIYFLCLAALTIYVLIATWPVVDRDVWNEGAPYALEDSGRVPSPGMAHDAIASLLAIFPRADPLKRSR
jgi:hypothetical protein